MASIRPHRCRAICLLVPASFAMLLSACQLSGLTGKNCGEEGCPGRARVCDEPTIRALAHDLDALEAHIEKYGSIVVQQPSVWGQARLTAHRQQFEIEMAKELPNFAATLNGTLSRTDQAYFINALALSNAASSQHGLAGGSAASSSSSATSPLDTSTQDITGAFTNITRNPAAMPALVGFKGLAGSSGVTLEPTTYLDQKKRFLDHLNELRRINEGDDTADAPGYALNLVRIPVSVLPGQCTERGYGAEVTMTLKPYLSDDLLPSTFRNLVINDLLEVIGVPLTHFLNNPDGVGYLAAVKLEREIMDEGEEKNAVEPAPTPPQPQPRPTRVRGVPRPTLEQIQKFDKFSSPAYQAFIKLPRVKAERAQNPAAPFAPNKLAQSIFDVKQHLPRFIPVISATKVRQAVRPFPPSQSLDIFGPYEALYVALKANDALRSEPPNKYWVHYPDVQGYLQEELQAAYRFLADPNNMGLWSYCSQDLVSAIHTRNTENVKILRNRYGDHVYAMTKRDMNEDTTAALAWAIIVEAALLNDQLVKDMTESAAARNCPCPLNAWQPYFLPEPPPEARQAFNEYVRCRWPIIVFALDPAADQQNIADTSSQTREMQLAMSLAFVSGNLSAKNLTRYARRLETQMEAIQLNNTIVGFSHGNDTFGWRFYPRFQTPDTQGNMTVFFRDLLLGDQSKDTLLRQRRLEPGQRECSAIVVMPSFVPYCTLDVSSSWFKLTDPKCRDMKCVDAVKLSARVKAIETCADRVLDADCYRDGELERLKKKAKQLEARLPLQDTMVQVPYENTLGGFAMFNTGITDLAPELYGWYGGPGINTNDTTTIFLIGNHFNVMSTRVVAGGLAIDPTSVVMLSRQVMQVTIPKGALMIERDTGTFARTPENPQPQTTTTKIDLDGKLDLNKIVSATASVNGTIDVTTPAPAAKPQELFVNVHVATPYGVTSHLLVPALGPKGLQAGASGMAANPIINWSPNAIAVGFVPKGLGIASSYPPTVRPADLTLAFNTPASNANNADLTLTITGAGTAVSSPFTLSGVALGADSKTLTLTAAQRDALVKAVFDKIGPQLTREIAPANPAKVAIKSILLKKDTAQLGTITPPDGAALLIQFVPAAEEKHPAAKQADNASH